MELIEKFEHPLPILHMEIEKIMVKITVLGFSGSLKIRNSGGSLLSGTILTKSEYIDFEIEKFQGNNLELYYKINLDMYKNGDIINTSIGIMSNGGEKNIPVTIEVVPYAITTDEGFSIASLKDFSEYVKKFPIQCRTLFVSNEFKHWILNSGFEFMEIYERLIKDTNRERAIENFLILSKTKEPLTLDIEKSQIEYEILEDRIEKIKGRVEIEKSGWGYIEQDIKSQYDSPWFKIYTEKLVSGDFNDTDKATIEYEIDPRKISGTVAFEKIILVEKEIVIKISKTSLYTIKLEKRFLNFNEVGKIIFENRSKREVIINITPRDNFLKFDAKKYVTKNHEIITFIAKPTKIRQAQMSIQKKPTIKGEIDIMLIDGEKIISKTLNVTVGDFMD